MAAAAGRQLFLARRAAWLLSALPCCAPAPGPASVGPSASAPPGRFNLSIGLVFPTHPPHFAWACNLVASARGQTRAKLYAAFGSEKEAAAFHGAYATPLALAPSLGALLRLSDEWQLSALVVPIGGAGTSKAVPTFKKWRALRELFARTPAEHLLAIDDESLVRPRSPADPDLPWYLAQHHAQRHVLVGPPFWAHWGSATRAYGTGTEGWSGAGGAEAGASAPLARAEGRFATSKYKITAVSCAIVGAPPLPGFAWWADLPVYDRADFGDFYRRLDMGLARTWYAFDHLTYLCYKAFYRGWEARAAPTRQRAPEPRTRPPRARVTARLPPRPAPCAAGAGGRAPGGEHGLQRAAALRAVAHLRMGERRWVR